MKTSIILAFAALCVFSAYADQGAEYDPSFAEYTLRAADLAYCCKKNLVNWNCGSLCDELAERVDYEVFVEIPTKFMDSVAYVIVRDDDAKIIFASFRGTNTMYQLLLEGLTERNENYDLHDIPDACVQSIFFDRYKVVRQHFLENITHYYNQYSDYTFVITGHSLGAALSTHAALDVVLSNIIPREQVVVYNFGSPRVGNYAFAQKYDEVIITNWRVVHYNDIFITWPVPCGKDSHGNCITEQDNPHYGQPGGSFYGWHTKGQAFYTKNEDSFQICDSEENDCADQFHSIFKKSITNHLRYMGVGLGCGSLKIPPLADDQFNFEFGKEPYTSACVKLPHLSLNEFWLDIMNMSANEEYILE
eukprot:CAMPEP_0114587870 /NCGR_PEP_ID=MMETSP0125-20121206/10720_1 /TAXON_ID=485358 ORGANISM="Aristerostoma sp., Strain ATCC 50986" /NCGR_SAMPLE_ID=MMETSP0125 /ASSEMBLY_ACC=CAM_ASM_000245 /LENGTH=361 /DNA_ID=CAMNT_0001783993 /DNA_START=69 /DNA_END=1154 /DNA_ORIENTATION=+